MTSYVTPKKNTQFIIYIGLPSQSTPHTMQSNPTIAAGDFKVSIDGGALNNLTTLPAVTPASSKMVKITLSSSEMNGDNITVVCSDAAGAEWDDVIFNIQTTAQQIDDIPTAAAITTSVLTTQMTESYNADGVAPTLAQAQFLALQTFSEFAISGTTITVKKLDGSTTAATYTLDSATTPTSRTRAT